MKVTRIVDSEFKTGTSDKGRWTLIKIEAEGKEATGFGPVIVGDEVDLSFNEKYKNYSFKVLDRAEAPKKTATSPSVELIVEKLDQILDILDPPKAIDIKATDMVDEDIGDEPINLDDIPY